MKEEWRAVIGFEGFYEVSNLGNVRSLAVYNARTNKVIQRKIPRLRKQETSKDGYKRVLLCLYGKHYHQMVHRLVARAFIPNPNNLPEVNHKDEDTRNNIMTNLEWCTASYNSNYGTLPKRISERMQMEHPTAKVVYQYTQDGVFVTAYKSANEAGRAIGLKNGDMVTRVCRGQAKTAKGFIFKYVR